MSNVHLRDKRLSLKAKGLLSVVLSLPDNWDYSVAGLCAICKEGISAVNSALDELKKYGYLTVRKIMPNESESGRIEYEYIFREQPEAEQAEQPNRKQDAEKQDIDFLPLENHRQLNTNKLNTNKLNTNNIYIVVEHLNSVVGSHYRADSADTKRLLSALFDNGYTIDDIISVIDKKASEWLGTEYARYLRPSTLFGTRFEEYLNAPTQERATQERYEPTHDIAEIERQLDAEFREDEWQ